ncbi:MAG: insulinase family protein [Anaerolineales bacterium]|nr:insulinase family protein [Anaerolineales bacterium]
MGKVDSIFPKLDVRALPGPKTIKRCELPNGVVVLSRSNFASPSVVVFGYLAVGSLDESYEQAGLSQLTAQALMRGTNERSFQEIFEAIESVGARLGFGAATHTTTFQGKALVEDLELLLEVLADALRNPTFPSVEFERLKAQHLTALAIRDQDTGSRAQLSFDELAYPNHPYRIPTAGYRKTVEGLQTSDLREFHRHQFGPTGMVVALVGSLEEEEAIGAVERVLGDWHELEGDARPPLPPVERPASLVRQDVQLAGKSQADIVIGTPGPSRYEEHYLAAALGNNILGRFGLFGRIGDAVRDTAGLAYYAYSSLTGGPGPGPWQVNAGVNPSNVEGAIELIRKEIKRFVSRRVSEQELTDNQANFIGRLPLQLESNEGVASALLHMERYSLGLDYYQRYPDLIASVTRDRILELGRRFLDPDRLAIAVAGPDQEG